MSIRLKCSVCGGLDDSFNEFVDISDVYKMLPIICSMCSSKQKSTTESTE